MKANLLNVPCCLFKTIDTSQITFDYADYESVLKILLSFKVIVQIGS